MTTFNQDDLEAFLVQADLVNQKVKALANNQLSPQEFDQLEAARAEDLRKRQLAKKRKADQVLQKKKQGQQGKGITKDFQNFCRLCHWQYQFPTPTCLRCQKPTMTLQQRQKQLEYMVDQYKQKKKKRQQRKVNWQRWQKTKAMLWKKTSNNYDKWEYFLSDSQQQPQQEPIVPKNDPNFMALQKDMEDRKKQRAKDTQQAKKLKEKGNAQMKKGNYQKAIEYYHLALQHIKDIKSIYTNRALAYIKLGKYQKAIKDCTNVIEYMQIFQKGGEGKDLMFKALLRRSSALKQKKQYRQASQDIKKALQIYPNDSSAKILQKQLQGFIEHTQKVAKILRDNNPKNQAQNQKEQNIPTQEISKQQQKSIIKQIAEAELSVQNNQSAQPIEEKKVQNNQSPKNKQEPKKAVNPIEQIKQKVEDLSQDSIEKIFQMISLNQQLKTIFIAVKGIKKCLEQLVKAQECRRQGYLINACLKGDGVGQNQVWEFGVQKLHKKVTQILSDNNQLRISRYFILEDIFQVLIPMSLHEKYRPMIADSLETHKFLEATFTRLISRHKKQPDLLSSFLIYLSNLCYGASKLRDSFINESIAKLLISTLYEKILVKKTVNRNHLNLKKNVYGFYAHLVINQRHRLTFIEYFNSKQQRGDLTLQRWNQIIKELKTYPISQDNFNSYIQTVLSTLVNVSLGTNLCVQGLPECINNRFINNPGIYNNQILHRSLLVLTRLKIDNSQTRKQILKNTTKNLQIIEGVKGQKNLMEQIIRLLNFIYTSNQLCNQGFPKGLMKKSTKFISSLDFGQILFCNTCNLFSVLIDNTTNPELKSKLLKQLKPHMKFLIDVAKQKIGNWRKNASILLAKMSLDPDCREQLNRNHGMDVLKSIAQYVKSS